eukprot:s106_g7.t1
MCLRTRIASQRSLFFFLGYSTRSSIDCSNASSSDSGVKKASPVPCRRGGEGRCFAARPGGFPSAVVTGRTLDVTVRASIGEQAEQVDNSDF